MKRLLYIIKSRNIQLGTEHLQTSAEVMREEFEKKLHQSDLSFGDLAKEVKNHTRRREFKKLGKLYHDLSGVKDSKALPT